MEKITQELLNELKQSSNVYEYLNENRDELYSMSLKEYLEQQLVENNITKAGVIARSGLNQIYAYQIFSGKKQPSRDKLLALAFGIGLELTAMQRLLRLAGLSELYARNRRDCILIFAANKRLDTVSCNELLYESGEYILG